MITDLSPYLVYELGSMQGQEVSLCRYSLHQSKQTDGYAILGNHFAFFIRIKTHYVVDEFPVHFLDISAFHQSEIGDAVEFHVERKGEMKELQLLKHTIRGMIVNHKVIQDITTECGMLFTFMDDTQWMIYPKSQLFTQTAIATDLDEILDEMHTNRLACSRLAVKDINLLLCEQ